MWSRAWPFELLRLAAGGQPRSPIADYWHHWSDVAAGACIGNLAAYFAYRLRYPPPWVGDATPHAALLDAAAASKHLRGKLSPPSEV